MIDNMSLSQDCGVYAGQGALEYHVLKWSLKALLNATYLDLVRERYVRIEHDIRCLHVTRLRRYDERASFDHLTIKLVPQRFATVKPIRIW